jgi:hypothetical protein
MNRHPERWARVLSIRLDEPERALLAELCELTGGTRSSVLRAALRRYHRWLTSTPHHAAQKRPGVILDTPRGPR